MHTHVDFCMPMQLSNNNKKGMCTSAQIFACSCNFWLASEKLQFPIWQLTSKETKRQAITKDQKNQMKAKPIEF